MTNNQETQPPTQAAMSDGEYARRLRELDAIGGTTRVYPLAVEFIIQLKKELEAVRAENKKLMNYLCPVMDGPQEDK